MPRSAASAVLPSSSAARTGSSTGAHDLVGEHLREPQLLGGELDGLLGASHLDQGHDGVQPVGGLVVLRAQRLGEAAHDIELAGHRTAARCGRAA